MNTFVGIARFIGALSMLYPLAFPLLLMSMTLAYSSVRIQIDPSSVRLRAFDGTPLVFGLCASTVLSLVLVWFALKPERLDGRWVVAVE